MALELAHGRSADLRYEEPIKPLGIDKTVALLDEFAAGHLGRYRLLKQATTRASALLLLRLATGRQGESALLALSEMSGLDFKAYTRNHSLLSFTCFITHIPRDADMNGFWDRSRALYAGLQSPRARAYSCPACVEADMSGRGYSYWRRAHQLPGVHRCLEHGAPLVSIPRQDAFDDMPSSVANVSTASPEETACCDHPLAIKFSGTIHAMLATGRSWPVESVRAGLRTRAKDLQLLPRTSGRSPRLSDLAVAAFPRPLLNELIPETTDKERGCSLSTIDSALSGQVCPVVSVAIAMTLLFSSPEEAIRACCFVA